MGKENRHRLLVGLASGLASMRKIRELYDETVAFRFNPFNFLKVRELENKYSDVLAFLLNPTETHAQKATFLNIFLKKLEQKGLKNVLTPTHCTDVRVHREYRTETERRIDIVIQSKIQGKKPFFIGIENKIYVWTKEQYNQLSDYARTLDKRSKGQFLLLYLTPTGDDPESISENEREKLLNAGKFQNITYKDDIIPFLLCCEHACKANRVRDFIQDFRKNLEVQYSGGGFMEEKKYVTGHIMEGMDAQKMDAALDVIGAQNDIKAALFESLETEIREFLKKHKFLGGTELDLQCTSAYQSPISVYRESWGKVQIAFEFQKTPHNRLFYGVVPGRGQKKLQDFLRARGYKVKSNDYWSYYEYLEEAEYGNWGASILPWKKMLRPNNTESSEFMKRIETIVCELADVLEEYFST